MRESVDTKRIEVTESEFIDLFTKKKSIYLCLSSEESDSGIIIHKQHEGFKRAGFYIGKPFFTPHKRIPSYIVRARFFNGSALLRELGKYPDLKYAVERLREREEERSLIGEAIPRVYKAVQQNQRSRAQSMEGVTWTRTTFQT